MVPRVLVVVPPAGAAPAATAGRHWSGSNPTQDPGEDAMRAPASGNGERVGNWLEIYPQCVFKHQNVWVFLEMFGSKRFWVVFTTSATNQFLLFL
jgi:hypothetical protein